MKRGHDEKKTIAAHLHHASWPRSRPGWEQIKRRGDQKDDLESGRNPVGRETRELKQMEKPWVNGGIRLATCEYSKNLSFVFGGFRCSDGPYDVLRKFPCFDVPGRLFRKIYLR